MSDTVNNSPIQDYIHPQDHAPPTYEWLQECSNISLFMGILASTLYQGMALYFFVPSGLFDLLMLIKIWIERSLTAA